MTPTKKEKTKKFIEQYLAKGQVQKGMTYYGMLNATRGTCQWAVAQAIRSMSYCDFMHTFYWQLVSWQVKHDANWRCVISGSKWNLEVHHNNYEHHGFEVFHLDDLVCVSRKRHRLMHKLACNKRGIYGGRHGRWYR